MSRHRMLGPVMGRLCGLGLVLAISFFCLPPVFAQQVVVTLNDGRQYEGRISGLSGYSLTPGALLVPGGRFPVVMIDDGLRRVFLNANRRAAREVPLEHNPEIFEIWQNEFENNQGHGVGPIMGQTPFDEFGRRIVTLMEAGGGRASYVQGIREITPSYVRVVGLQTKGKDRYFDMRLATSTIPRDVIVKLLHRHVKDPESSIERRRLVAFFTEAEMFEEADLELKLMQEKFPGQKKELAELRQTLQLQIHRRALNEIRFRYEAGQSKLAGELWRAYPDKRTMPGEIAAEFHDLDEQMQNADKNLEGVRQSVVSMIELAMNSDEFEPAQKRILNEFQAELEANIGFSNVDRLTTYFRFADDATQTLSQKISYALSGWYVGSAKATDNFAVAQSLPLTRRMIREYLSQADAARRESILGELEKMETGTPEYIALIIANMRPVSPPQNPVAPGQPYRFETEIAAPQGKTETIEYFVQLPPEYDPYRRYPCVVSLPTTGFDPKVQLEWWVGRYLPKLKIHSGPASRHGYIVISPRWYAAKQTEYEYGVRSHDAVLSSLRDAMRKFSIDTDKVFLSGHFKGGDAAWDIGLSHPDLWAGVIPISAKPDKYIVHYYETALNNAIPFYLVLGSKDYGIRGVSPTDPHTLTLNRWLGKSDVDCTVVEYQGRGGENFYEEIHEIFNWMKLKKRQWVPQEFNGRSLRPTDNFFWNVEVGTIPSKSDVPPVVWDIVQRDTFKITVKQKANNAFHFSPGRIGADISFWLGPEFVDFSKNVEIEGRGNKFKKSVTPSRKVILEDVRRRADRQHPFWARVFCAKTKWVEQE